MKAINLCLSFFSVRVAADNVTCPTEIKVTIPTAIWPDEPKMQISSMAQLHVVLSACQTVTSLDLRVADIGCIGQPDRSSFPLDPAGSSHYPSTIHSLSIEGYRFGDSEWDRVQPPRYRHQSYSAWVSSGDAWKWAKWQFLLSPEERSTLNIDLWLAAMNFSGIRTLSIRDAIDPDAPEILAARLPQHMPGLRSLSVDGESWDALVISFPENSLEHLSWVNPGRRSRFEVVSRRYGQSLSSLEWRTPEDIVSRRPSLSVGQLRDLRTTLPNLVSLTIDMNRENDTWPWDELQALSSGLPDSLTNITLYFEMASECRRQKIDDSLDRCDDPCGPAEQYARPLLTTESSLKLAKALAADKKGRSLEHVRFRAGDWVRPYDGPVAASGWLAGRKAEIECTSAKDREVVNCVGQDTKISQQELEYFGHVCNYI